MEKDNWLVRECTKENELAQKELFVRFAPGMRAVCSRYMGNEEDTKDCLQEGFIKVFSRIKTYRGEGSLASWIKRIMINTAIEHYHRKKKYSIRGISEQDEQRLMEEFVPASFEKKLDKEDYTASFCYDLMIKSDLTEKELYNLVLGLPEHFRVPFNLYFIEKFSHKQISELLGIDETTSRTRILRAKKLLKAALFELGYYKMTK